MQTIALPKKIEFQKIEENRDLVIIEPCFPGYGITFGNSLRRVLLSSLSGAAVIGIKIKGADHEFMTLPHVQEDILQIILNLKQLRMRVHTEEVVKLELDVHGEKQVTAGDIKPNADVEIVSKNLVIANITDMAGNLNIEIFVRQGRGYETIESREGGKNEIGYIEMDSIFTPIMSVGINVENVRVGKITNWDKLVLNILTDGSITPKQAFDQAVKVLIEQFSALVDLEKGQTKEDDSIEPESIVEEKVTDIIEDETEAVEENNEIDSKKRRGRPKKN